MTIRERIKAGEFDNKVPFPIRNSKLCNVDKQEQCKHELAMEEYRYGIRDSVRRLRNALEKEYHLVGHPKADLLWEICWSHGHSCGLEEVVGWYEELSGLLKV